MNKRTRSGLKIGWVIFAATLLIVSAPLALYLLGASLFFFGWNGAWGGERSQSVDLDILLHFFLPGIAPLAVVCVVSFLLFRRFKRADRMEMQQELYAELAPGVTLEEKKILHTLQQNGALSLPQLVSATNLSQERCLTTVRQLLQSGMIRQRVSPDGAIFSLVNEENDTISTRE